jgi:hypothetical protein
MKMRRKENIVHVAEDVICRSLLMKLKALFLIIPNAFKIVHIKPWIAVGLQGDVFLVGSCSEFQVQGRKKIFLMESTTLYVGYMLKLLH